MKDEIQRKADKEFAAQLLKDIPYFHQLYAKYHDQKWLEIAKNCGEVLSQLYKKWI